MKHLLAPDMETRFPEPQCSLSSPRTIPTPAVWTNQQETLVSRWSTFADCSIRDAFLNTECCPFLSAQIPCCSWNGWIFTSEIVTVLQLPAGV